MKLNLGILYKDNKIVNHRSLIKVLFNPILRYFGLFIGTKCKNNKLGFIKIYKCKKTNKIIWNLSSYNEFDFKIKKRILI